MESAEGFEVISYIPAPCLKYNQPGTTYTCVQLPDDPTAGKVIKCVVIWENQSHGARYQI